MKQIGEKGKSICHSLPEYIKGTVHHHFKISELLQICSHKLYMMSKYESHQPHVNGQPHILLKWLKQTMY